MSIREDREWINDAIDRLQKHILENPKGRIYMMDELYQLQEDLKDLRTRFVKKTKHPLTKGGNI